MKDHSHQLVLDSIVADYPLYRRLVACTSIYLSTHTGLGLYGCFWVLSVQHGRSDWIIDRNLSISHQRNGRKEMIHLENVHKAMAKPRFKGLVCRFRTRDDVVILGPSGSKSTLLNVLSETKRLLRRHILIQGRDLSQLTDAQLTDFRREKIAFIFQQYCTESNG